MSSFKNIFRNSNKDHSTSDHKRAKSSSANTSSSNSQYLASGDNSFDVGGGAFPSKNGSVPVSPFSAPVSLPAIDVTDVSSLDQDDHRSPAESNVSTLTPAKTFPQSNSVGRDSKSKAMARPSSTNHSQWRSESVGAHSNAGGKSSRRGSKVEKSDDGHGRGEPLNRHELMRRAMATAQEYGEQDGEDSGSVFEDDQFSNSHQSHNAHPGQQSHPANSTPVTHRQAQRLSGASDRPGDGSLSIDAFGGGHPQTVSAGRSPSISSPNKPNHGPSPASQTLTASSTMPTLVTPAPIRAEIPRSDSLEEIINQGNVYGHMQGVDPHHADAFRGPPNRASTMMMERQNSPTRVQGMGKSASSSALLKPTDVPSVADGSPRRPSDTGSINGAFSRLRKNSNSSTVSTASKSKKTGPSGGIAGALAASGMAGLGVGHAGVLQQGQASLADANSASAKKRKEPINSTSHDSAPGGAIDRDQEGQQLHSHRPQRDRSASSFISHDSSVVSDQSSVSGLGAAAGFGAASAALLSSIGGMSGMPVISPLPTGNGAHPMGAGGLVPPEAGGGGGGGDHIDGETAWPEDMGPQITGFAVASSKRNNEFHQLFPQVPEDDYLIEDYGCALVREILIQGRIYISENHLCFKANIFGWVTNVVLPFSEIISIEKRMTAFVIPNAIQIATLQSKHNFTSFLSRDATYDLVVNIWKLSHPGVPIAAADQADLSDEYSEIEEEGDDSAATGATGADGKGGDNDQGRSGGDSKPSKRARLKRKLKGTKTGVRDENLAAVAAAAARSGTPLIPQSRSPAPGNKRTAHRKTTCPCEDKKEHFSSVALDTTYPAVPEKIYNLLFTSTFMKEFWTDNQKLMDLQISEWSPSSDNRNLLSRNVSYIKPLAGGFGPKQTKCNITDENLHVDFDNYVVTLTTTRTPDVPSGGSFSVKTKTCITWAGTGNVSHVYVTFQVEWSGRSMLRSIIDKASADGQKQYYKELDEAVRKYLTDHTSEFKEEGDDAAAVEEIARAATPGPNSMKGGAAGDASGAKKEESSPSGAGNSAASGGQSGGMLDQITAPIMDGLGMVSDLLGGALEMVGIEGGVSPKSLVFCFIIFVLFVMNLWTWRRSSPAASSRHLQNLDRMQAGGVNRGYFTEQGYYGPVSPRHNRGEGGYDRIFAPNVYITPPGGQDATPDAIAKTVTEVLERLYQQNMDRFMPKGSAETDGDDPESVKRLMAEAEAVFKRLETRLKAVTSKEGQSDGKKKRGKAEL
ncbi:GRAM domain protein [Kalmanozyma brasiliensis GHG001]|uniref:VASt domain-containing protein n=1 Tax=Kalmanozyma brasiliensis (strain GHG001) TaxID=1365824 RepID=V5EPM0_KALBG|nr:GRAM domain protein [Kalmanozyma brasiliensis GHG001]EST04893.1 GRAM domain protein [Kalmanozyma brasiliensis GHG001]